MSFLMQTGGTNNYIFTWARVIFPKHRPDWIAKTPRTGCKFPSGSTKLSFGTWTGEFITQDRETNEVFHDRHFRYE